MIIAISGLPGSGKSTVGKILAKKLGYKFYSMGDMRGKMAMERGLTINELNKLGEKEDWTDKIVDEYQQELGEKEQNFIIDGRLSFYFIPHAYKIFLTVNPREAAKRVFSDPRPDEKKVNSIEEQIKAMQKRVRDDEKRYKKYYNVSFTKEKNYNLVIDTTRLNLNEVVAEIYRVLPQ